MKGANIETISVSSTSRHPLGLTLIEIALVLVIIGILTGLGAGLIGVLTKRAKISETKENLNANVEAIISWAVGHKRLPSLGEFTSVNNYVVQNPYDAWGKRFYYIVDEGLTQSASATGNTVCDRKTTNLTVAYCKDPTCSQKEEIQNVAFILISGGANFNNQTYGNEAVSQPRTVYVYEPDTKVDGYSSSDDPARVEEYDDIVKWVTLNRLRIAAGCQEAQLRILNNELPYGYAGSQYNANVYAEGGVPYPDGPDNGQLLEYEWCVETIDGNKPSNLTFKTTYNEELNINNFTSQNPNDRCDTTTQQGDWKRSDYLIVEGQPSSQGAYKIIVYARDDQAPEKNRTSKSFVLTINPQSSSGGGSGVPPGSQISFENNISDFQTVTNNQNSVQVSGNGVVFGGGVGNSYSCFWFPAVQTLQGKTMRAYFKFKFLTVDTSSDSRQYADGLTFAVVDGNMPLTACGGLGVDIGFGGLGYRSVALEVDTYPNTGSWRYDPANNHVAVVKDGNNSHTGQNPSCQNSEGCKPGHYATWLEDGIEHSIRIEMITGCNPQCNNCDGHPQNYALFKAWVDCGTTCRDLTQNYGDTPTVSHCFQLLSVMNSVKFGFTQGTGGAVQRVEVKDFGIGFY